MFKVGDKVKIIEILKAYSSLTFEIIDGPKEKNQFKYQTWYRIIDFNNRTKVVDIYENHLTFDELYYRKFKLNKIYDRIK